MERCRPVPPPDGLSARHGRQQASGAPVDAAWVIVRLEEAGRTLLALPQAGYATGLRSSGAWEFLRMAAEAEAWPSASGPARPAVPPAARIDRMDDAWGWLSLIPQDRYVLRRIVGARALVHPLTDRHLYSWRKLGTVLGADHKAVQRWHAWGISLIVVGLSERGVAA
jgi:hypothetical protein